MFNRYRSINHICQVLGLTEHQIRWFRNRIDTFLKITKLNLELRIVDETVVNLTTKVPLSSHLKLVDIMGINLKAIPMNVLYAYLDDKQTIYRVRGR